MPNLDRRGLLVGAGAGLLASRAVAKAMAIDADVRHGSLQDVQHVVILMQENRGFDHYFGALAGVRGFGDRFPIPSAMGPARQTVWIQSHGAAAPAAIAPFHLDTVRDYPLMAALGTPHTWPDAQAAWDEGRMSRWPDAKTVRSMGHYRGEDLPFQFALAEAFTLCDAYHCSIQTGTNSNRLYLWTGTNDPTGEQGGPAIGNSHDRLAKDGGAPEGYSWTTYVERLQAAGVSWRIYEDMADNFTDNPLAGFRRFRAAHDAGPGGPDHELIERGMSTNKLDRLKQDVLDGTLPQVSYIVSHAAASEHPAASSPAQGADYTAQVLDALTSNPEVWSRTALLVMFDENDGFFDHMPPPAPPSRDASAPGGWAGASTVSTALEYHLVRSTSDAASEKPELIGRPYGLGPRVPMYVISPWSRGGWVNSQVFDHTSVIRLLEQRFGVHEPNISPWRRTVCGDLTSAFDFKHPNASFSTASLPQTAQASVRAAALKTRPPAVPPAEPAMPAQAFGPRRSRALPYDLEVVADATDSGVRLMFANAGGAGAVFHVYDRLQRLKAPRRYTVGAAHRLEGVWPAATAGEPYDLWVLGPNGFHRHVAGQASNAALQASLRAGPGRRSIELGIVNPDKAARRIEVRPMAYESSMAVKTTTARPGRPSTLRWSVVETSGWYDLVVRDLADETYLRRFAGRLETGRDSVSDPALGGAALRLHAL
jgi:phospholipase C